MASYPEYVNGEPPVIRLAEYDNAEWMNQTCVDHNAQENVYYVVLYDDPERKIAKIDTKDNFKLDLIFQSAKQKAGKELVEQQLEERKKERESKSKA